MLARVRYAADLAYLSRARRALFIYARSTPTSTSSSGPATGRRPSRGESSRLPAVERPRAPRIQGAPQCDQRGDRACAVARHRRGDQLLRLRLAANRPRAGGRHQRAPDEGLVATGLSPVQGTGPVQAGLQRCAVSADTLRQGWSASRRCDEKWHTAAPVAAVSY